MEINNKIIPIFAGLAAVALVMNWVRIKRGFVKTKQGSSHKLEAVINHLKPHALAISSKKKSKNGKKGKVVTAFSGVNRLEKSIEDSSAATKLETVDPVHKQDSLHQDMVKEEAVVA